MNLAQTHGHALTVKQKIKETSNAFTFVLEVPDQDQNIYAYKAGQYLTLFLEVEGQALRRSYSISSAPSCDRHLSISVKRVTGGRGSNWLCDHLKQGQTLVASAPMGQFFQPNEAVKECLLFAAGSGITPIFSILKETLTTSSARVILFFGNRSQEDIIYRQQLIEWENRFPNRLKIQHHLSEAAGRCSIETIKSFLQNIQLEDKFKSQIYLCGPDGFMQNVEAACFEDGYTKSQIRRESFGSPLSSLENDVNSQTPSSSGVLSHLTGDEVIIGEGPDSTPQTLRATLNGEVVEVASNPGLTVLESLLAAGHNPPFSCMEGSCMACMARLKSGKVYQKEAGILTEDNIDQLEILTCQARPLTELVEVNFDEL